MGEERTTDGRTSRRPRTATWVAGVVAAVVLAGGAAAASGGDADRVELRAWSIDAPPLPIPAGDPGAPAADAAATDPGELDGGSAVAPAASPAAASDADERGSGDRLPSGAPSDAEVAADLKRALGRKEGSARTLISAATVDSRGLASVPVDAPPKVVQIIQAANEVARKPYVYGGGHGRFAGSIWTDTAYDCSGSISYALAAAGLIDAPMVSGAMASAFKPGPGKWVTIYANEGHAFMFVAGLRFDTSGLRQTGSRWQSATRSVAGFREVHLPGL